MHSQLSSSKPVLLQAPSSATETWRFCANCVGWQLVLEAEGSAARYEHSKSCLAGILFWLYFGQLTSLAVDSHVHAWLEAVLTGSLCAGRLQCGCGTGFADTADGNSIAQDLWIQCDGCNKWRELDAAEFKQIQVTHVPTKRDIDADLCSVVTVALSSSTQSIQATCMLHTPAGQRCRHQSLCSCIAKQTMLVASGGASIISPCACSKVAQMHIGNAPCFLMEPVVSHVMTGSWSKGGACVTWLQSSRSKMRNGNSRHVTTLLCCAVLCCAVLCCAVLCWMHASQKYELADMSVWRARL